MSHSRTECQNKVVIYICTPISHKQKLEWRSSRVAAQLEIYLPSSLFPLILAISEQVVRNVHPQIHKLQWRSQVLSSQRKLSGWSTPSCRNLGAARARRIDAAAAFRRWVPTNLCWCRSCLVVAVGVRWNPASSRRAWIGVGPGNTRAPAPSQAGVCQW